MSHFKTCRTAPVWFLMAFSGHALAGITVNDSSDTGPGDCTTICTLRDAIAAAGNGDTIIFSPAILPATIQLDLLKGQLNITKSIQIQGPGPTELSIAALGNRIFLISAGSDPTISGLSMRNGEVFGTDATSGQPGGSAAGGCVYIDSTSGALFDRVAFFNCVAVGGHGGQGSDGFSDDFGNCTLSGGDGTPGGDGGSAYGGAIYSSGSLALLNSSIAMAFAGGSSGGDGGTGGCGSPDGNGGNGANGGSAFGGAIFRGQSSFSLYIQNTTITESEASGGSGGYGGGLDSMNFSGSGGNGGNGGNASGGLLYSASTNPVGEMDFASLISGTVSPGAKGGGTSGGADGIDGQATSSAVYAWNKFGANATVIVGVQAGVSLCGGSVRGFGLANLDEDSSCIGFPLHHPLANLFRPLDPNITPWPGYMPIWHSVLVDAATSCNDWGATPVTADQHGTPRPQGSQCDLGAIEADYIFVASFE